MTISQIGFFLAVIYIDYSDQCEPILETIILILLKVAKYIFGLQQNRLFSIYSIPLPPRDYMCDK